MNIYVVLYSEEKQKLTRPAVFRFKNQHYLAKQTHGKVLHHHLKFHTSPLRVIQRLTLTLAGRFILK